MIESETLFFIILSIVHTTKGGNMMNENSQGPVTGRDHKHTAGRGTSNRDCG